MKQYMYIRTLQLLKEYSVQILAVLIIISGYGSHLYSPSKHDNNIYAYTSTLIKLPSGLLIKAVVGTSPAAISKGLMYETELNIDKGMLFKFDTIDTHSIWMKNMRIPLDLIWLDRNGLVTDVLHNVPPCPRDKDVCPVYTPASPAKYVLELSSGSAHLNKLIIGSKLIIDYQDVLGSAAVLKSRADTNKGGLSLSVKGLVVDGKHIPVNDTQVISDTNDKVLIRAQGVSIK